MKLEKFTVPTQYDVAPFMTLWQTNATVDHDSELYIQISENDAQPNWQRVGFVLEKAFSAFLVDKPFTEMCLRLFNKK
jgi:hypothetical protein